MKEHKICCADCDYEFMSHSDDMDAASRQRNPCPNCGSLERKINLYLDDKIQPKDDISLTMSTQKATGGKKTLLKGKYGSEFHHDTKTWQTRQRTFDIVNDEYEEKIFNPTSGYNKEVKENLSQHQNHGSAKKKK